MKHFILTTAGLILALVLTGLAGAGLSALNTTPASAATVQHVNWPDTVCHGFARWQRYHDTTDLNRMMTASEHVTWKYLGEDASNLYRAVRGHGDTDLATQYLADDCGQGGM